MRLITFSSAGGNTVSWKADSDGFVRGYVNVVGVGVLSLDPALTVTALHNPAGDQVEDGKFQLEFGGSGTWFQDIAQFIDKGSSIFMTPFAATPTVCQLLFDPLTAESQLTVK